MPENLAREAPKTLLEPGSQDPIWGSCLDPPEPLKIVLSLWRGAFFCCKNGMTRPGAQNGAQNDPQIEPQTTPRGFQIAKKIPPNRRLIVGQIPATILTILVGGSKMAPKSTLK